MAPSRRVAPPPIRLHKAGHDQGGIVKEVQWTNPHSFIQLMVDGSNGEKVQWSVEIGSPSLNVNIGWRKNSVKAGDIVTMEPSPARNENPMARFRVLTFADVNNSMALQRACAGQSVRRLRPLPRPLLRRQRIPEMRRPWLTACLLLVMGSAAQAASSPDAPAWHLGSGRSAAAIVAVERSAPPLNDAAALVYAGRKAQYARGNHCNFKEPDCLVRRAGHATRRAHA